MPARLELEGAITSRHAETSVAQLGILMLRDKHVREVEGPKFFVFLGTECAIDMRHAQ